MAATDPVLALHQLGLEWRAVQDATSDRVSPQRVRVASALWQLWLQFCEGLGVDPAHLPAHRLHTGTASPRRRSVRSRSVEDTLRAVGQAYANVGTKNPRLNSHGALDFRITSLYQSWAKVEDPPSRVKPLPVTLLTQCVHLASQEQTSLALTAADCLVIGFFVLLRPGEYIGTPNNRLDTLFHLCDLQLWIGTRALDILNCPITDVRSATFATLAYTCQKNGVRNEIIGHGRSGHPTISPVLCLIARMIALRALQAPPSTPLNAYRLTPGDELRYIQPADLTRRRRLTLTIHPHPAYFPADVSARSTRARGSHGLALRWRRS